MCGWYWPPAVSFSRICAATVLEAQAPDGAEGLYGYGAEDVVKEFEHYERLKKVSWRHLCISGVGPYARGAQLS